MMLWTPDERNPRRSLMAIIPGAVNRSSGTRNRVLQYINFNSVNTQARSAWFRAAGSCFSCGRRWR